MVVCHDAARPFASPALYDRVVAAVSGEVRGAVPGIRSPDTVKGSGVGTRGARRFPRDGARPGADAAGVRRRRPPGSRTSAPRARGWDVTDDAMLLELAGLAVAVVEGEEMNFKITTEADLRRAEWLVASGEL